MLDKQTDSQKFLKLTEELPDCCHGYLTTGLSENTLTTKIAYARDIKFFLEFAVNYYPHFAEKSIQDVSFEDLGQISAEDINVYLQVLKDQGLSEKTRSRRKAAISAMFNYMMNSQRKLTFNPVAGSTKIKLPEKTQSISPHKLRSSFAMEFYRNTDKDILTLQRRMGHKSIMTTNIYAKAAENEVKDMRNWRKK